MDISHYLNILFNQLSYQICFMKNSCNIHSALNDFLMNEMEHERPKLETRDPIRRIQAEVTDTWPYWQFDQ